MPLFLIVWTFIQSSLLVAGQALAAPESAKAPLVFIHGIKGARLVDADGAVAWATFWQGLGLSTPDLALAMRFDDGVQPRGALRADTVLASVPVIPGVFENEVYGPWLDAAGDFGLPFLPFAYDWRRDNNETVTAFIAFLDAAQAANGGQKIHVVAHSMGGLITLVALNERPELFASVTFAGVPFKGGIGFLPDLHAGVPTGINDELLSPQVLATFPSVYTLFPDVPGTFVTDAAGAPVPIDFFAASDWCRLKMGPCVGGVLPDAAGRFFSQALALAAQFRQRMQPREDARYPPVLVVAGNRHPTLAQVVQDGPQSVRGWDFVTAPSVPGDDRVAFADAVPPLRIPYKRFVTTHAHADLLNDPKVILAIKSFLTE